MDEHTARIILSYISFDVRDNKDDKVREHLSKLVEDADVKITLNLFRAANEIGGLFSYFEGYPYVNFINSLLKNKDSILLRLIREEIMFNDPRYDSQEIMRVVDVDLRKHPEEPYFLNTKAMTCREMKNYDSAMKFIELALYYDPKNIDFLRNQALIYIDLEDFDDASHTIIKARLVHLHDENLKKMEDYIDFQESIYGQKVILKKLEGSILKQSKHIKNIRFDFVAFAGIFIAFLTIVIRMVTFDYTNFKSYSSSEIFLQQILINSPWLISIALLLIILLIIYLKKNK